MIKIANNLIKLSNTYSFSKRSDGLSDFLNKVVDTAPYSFGAIGGLGFGALGAGTGALIEYLRGNKQKNYLKAMLIGGGTGAILGAARGAYKGIGLREKIEAEREKQKNEEVLNDPTRQEKAQAQSLQGRWGPSLGDNTPDNTIQGRIDS